MDQHTSLLRPGRHTDPIIITNDELRVGSCINAGRYHEVGSAGVERYDEKCSKYAKSKLSYKSSRRAVKQDWGLAEDISNSVRTVDKNHPVSYYCRSVFAGLPLSVHVQDLPRSVVVPPNSNRRILESLHFQGEQ
jgi:hypothetical protein